MCSSNMSGNLRYCNIRIWSWQWLELNSVWEKQKQRRSFLAYSMFHPLKKNPNNPPFPHKQLKTKTPNVSTRFRFCRKPWSSFPELKAVALSGFPTHPALPTVPLESTRPRQVGTGKESSGSRAFPIPSTFYTGRRCLGARPSMAKHTLPGTRRGPAQAFPPPARPSRRAPAPHLLRDPLRLVGGGPGRRGSPAQHGGTYVVLPAPLRADPAPRVVSGAVPGPGLKPAGGVRRPRRWRAGAAGPSTAQPGRPQRGPAGVALPSFGGSIAARRPMEHKNSP